MDTLRAINEYSDEVTEDSSTACMHACTMYCTISRLQNMHAVSQEHAHVSHSCYMLLIIGDCFHPSSSQAFGKFPVCFMVDCIWYNVMSSVTFRLWSCMHRCCQTLHASQGMQQIPQRQGAQDVCIQTIYFAMHDC